MTEDIIVCPVDWKHDLDTDWLYCEVDDVDAVHIPGER